MYCTNCGNAVETDDKFCRECGHRVSEPKLGPDDHLKIGELIYAAYKYQEIGGIDDAILSCQSALALNDKSPQAHALLGSLYESKGDFISAIREYVRSVELDPENKANYQKLEDLRNGRVSPPSQPSQVSILERLKPHAPVASAIATLIIILVVGLSLARTPAKETKLDAGNRDTGQSGIPRVALPAQPYAHQQYTQGQSQATGQRQPELPATPPQAAANTQRQGIPPVPLPKVQSLANNQSSSNYQSNDTPVIVPVIETSPNTPSSAPRANPPAVSSESEPVIRYTSTPAIQPQIDPEEKGLQLQQARKYREAISAYREATAKTNDPGRIYQQMALCYQRLGENDMAIDSYNRAISSYKKQLSAGRDSAEVQRNIRACEAGIKASQ